MSGKAMTVAALRAALDGLPGGMPVVAPIGVENCAYAVEAAKVCQGRNEAPDGSSGLWAVKADEHVNDTYDKESCCGQPMHGPVVDVLWLW